jgi:hypothetical protein
MREVGYEWDSKNKELRKIIKPKFNVGDKVIYKGKVRTITRIVEGYYEFDGWAASCRIEKQDELLSAAPNFKVGDWVVTDYGKVSQVVSVDKDGDGYTLDDGVYFSGSWCDMYHRWTIQDVKDGDILSAKIDGDDYILIFKLIKDGWIETYGHYYITIDKFCTPTQMFCRDYQGKLYPATKEQRERLFAKLREEGYTWDEEKKELKRSIKPKFKLHDIIMRGSNLYGMRTITYVNTEKMTYGLSCGKDIPFSEQDLWHLANSHYLIQYFKPFDKVLVRDDDNECWMPSLFGWFDSGLQDGKFVCGTSDWEQCIPFKGNEKLVGTTNPCAQEYVNW